MPNFNKVLLMGNLTRDPELRYTPSGSAVADFGVAVNRKWTGQNGEKKEEACFVDCQAWTRSAEVISEYCKKGSAIFIEGRLKLDSWEGRDGQKHSRLRVVVENFQFVGAPAGRRPGAPGAPAGTAPSRPASRRAEEAEPPPPEDVDAEPPAEGPLKSNDDIPF